MSNQQQQQFPPVITTLQDFTPIIVSQVEQYLKECQSNSSSSCKLYIKNSTDPFVLGSKLRALYLFGSQVYFAKVLNSSSSSSNSTETETIVTTPATTTITTTTIPTVSVTATNERSSSLQSSSSPPQESPNMVVLKLFSPNTNHMIEYNLTHSDLDIILVCDDLYSENFDESGLTSNLQFKLSLDVCVKEENEQQNHCYRFISSSHSLNDQLQQEEEEQTTILESSSHFLHFNIELSLLNTNYFLSFLNYHQPILLQFISNHGDQFVIYEDSIMNEIGDNIGPLIL
ncbi:hypothetical protein FDP41_004138 [Naegleria fowleri]|uniref:Uncharacterized protein n=1 Tax=Naegleria fowleri TaxID=5763 RepID=A0A6A5BG64_NAEFO|nr:uncharacterized protein FDP41_004138 [Naegleria fowleri]KAF0976843.1 hypothetical protein FDP41_004138 [Naegleria fowleri]